MRIVSYKIIGLILVLGTFYLQGQKKDNDFKEEFNVKSDVVIDINTRHSDIQIHPWNKNKVVVEAYMMVEGEEVTEEMKDHFYAKWNFDAFGNSEKITINSRSNSRIDFNTFNFDNPDYTFIVDDLSDFSIGSLDVLDSIDFIMPPLPPEPPMFTGVIAPPAPPAPPMFFFTEFDFDEYKKDKDYLKRWKEENKEALGKNAKVKVGDKLISISTDDSNITMSGRQNGKNDLKFFIEEHEAHQKEREKKAKEYQKKMKEKIEKQLKKAEKAMKKNREKLEKQLKKLEKKKKERIKIQKLLKDRSKLKVKRLIIIRAPKDAKFNMNVKYGELSFAKN